MSTFNGFFKEFPHISADCFLDENVKSKVFFLSHCHTDHMNGLDFCYKFGLINVPIYLSEISKLFVDKTFPNNSFDLRVLELNSPVPINYEVDGVMYNLVATALGASHCPGSIMILLETQNSRILYTGDFRLDSRCFKRFLPQLENSSLDNVYLDSTFLLPEYMDFPSRSQSIDAICGIINEWIRNGPNYMIMLSLPANYGSEYLFIKISEKTGLKIHVKQNRYNEYIHIPLMDQAITINASECRIHACELNLKLWQASSFACSALGIKWRSIRVSALIWRYWKIGTSFIRNTGEEYHVAYSNHSSCSEIKSILDYLRPKSVELNVIDLKKGLEDTRFKVLEEILASKAVGESEIKEVECSDSESTVKPSTGRFNKILLQPKRGLKSKAAEELFDQLSQ